MQFSLEVNGEQHNLDVPADKPLLWVLREDLGLNATKFGCGVAQCGACSVQSASSSSATSVARPPLAPALSNALFAATGRRIRKLPIGDQLKV